MTLTMPKKVTGNIIKKVLMGQDYRIEVITLIDAIFLEYAIEFFKRVVDAKLNSNQIDSDWYKKSFLDNRNDSDEIIINSGLNRKTISNMYKSARKDIVIEAANDHYEKLYDTIKALVDQNNGGLNVLLTITFNSVSVQLGLSESLIVINTLAVKRAQIRGGLWSTAGKRVEKPLMLTLCRLFGVSNGNYLIKYRGKSETEDFGYNREIDFYLKNDENNYKCEVKLMGTGNPESADVVIARDSKVLVADTLSTQNKNQLDHLQVLWLELRQDHGLMKFGEILDRLGIPHSNFNGVLVKENVDKIIDEVVEY